MITDVRDYTLATDSTYRPSGAAPKHEAIPVVQVVVLPPPGAGNVDAPAIRTKLTVDHDTDADSLWNATWEDAEWR